MQLNLVPPNSFSLPVVTEILLVEGNGETLQKENVVFWFFGFLVFGFGVFQKQALSQCGWLSQVSPL